MVDRGQKRTSESVRNYSGQPNHGALNAEHRNVEQNQDGTGAQAQTTDLCTGLGWD